MSDDRKAAVFPPASAWRRVAVVGWLALVAAFGPFATAPAAASSTLEVEASNVLPGFHRGDLPRYLAQHMAEARLSDWHFEPGAGNTRAADRVEWSFRLNPYAGGEVRSFARSLFGERKFDAPRPITIEARLYLNGEYQTIVEEQAIVRGGPNDPDLAAVVAKITQNLLGSSGAYRGIDIGQHRADPAR
jgi:hypothetical protein